jgi:hypothetical protein
MPQSAYTKPGLDFSATPMCWGGEHPRIPSSRSGRSREGSTEIGAMWKDSLPRAIDGIISGALKITLQERELSAG